MSLPSKVEYRVRKITRYVVTRYHEIAEGNDGLLNRAGVQEKGEYPNPDVAYEVAYALAKQEHELLGWPVGDERLQYPQPIEAEPKAKAGGRRYADDVRAAHASLLGFGFADIPRNFAAQDADGEIRRAAHIRRGQ